MKHTFTHLVSCSTFFMLFGILAIAQPRLGFHLNYQPTDHSISQNGYRAAYGGSIEFMSSDLRHARGPVRLMMGGNFFLSGAGHEARDLDNPELLETGIARRSINNMQFGLRGLTRVMAPRTWPVQPYLDFSAGLATYVVGETLHFEEGGFDCEDSERNWESADWKFQAGAGLGVQVPVSTAVSLDFRTTYLRQGRVEHANLESVELNENFLEYELTRTRLSPWNFLLGVLVNLDEFDCSPSRENLD